MLKSEQQRLRLQKKKQSNADLPWPERIWIYKRVPKGPYRKCDQHKLKYDEHYNIKLIPSDQNLYWRERGWKIHPDQQLPWKTI